MNIFRFEWCTRLVAVVVLSPERQNRYLPQCEREMEAFGFGRGSDAILLYCYSGEEARGGVDD